MAGSPRRICARSTVSNVSSDKRSLRRTHNRVMTAHDPENAIANSSIITTTTHFPCSVPAFPLAYIAPITTSVALIAHPPPM